jgi:hypothetical protein
MGFNSGILHHVRSYYEREKIRLPYELFKHV